LNGTAINGGRELVVKYAMLPVEYRSEDDFSGRLTPTGTGHHINPSCSPQFIFSAGASAGPPVSTHSA